MAREGTADSHTTGALLPPSVPISSAPRRVAAPNATPPPGSSRRTLPDLERLSSFTDGAFFDCDSPRQSGAMLALTPSVAEVDYHEGAHTPAANDSEPAKPRDSTRPTHVILDDIGRLRVDSLSSDSSGAGQTSDVEYGELAQPHAEIILRWKRFLALVALSALVLSGVSVILRSGVTVQRDVSAAEAETRAETINMYSGLVMGFIESIVGLGFEELFPVFIVYLHNLKWYPADAPGVRETSKFKKVALMLFVPAFMVAVGSSLSAVQANQKDQSATSERMRMRHLQASGHASRLDDTILRSVVSPHVAGIPVLPEQCSLGDGDLEDASRLVNALPAVHYGFSSQDWHREASGAFGRLDGDTHSKVVLAADSDDDQLGMGGVALSTAHELLQQGRKVAREASQHRGTSRASSSRPRLERVHSISDLFRQAAAISQDFGIAIDTNRTQITLERFALSPLMNFEGIQVEMLQLDDVEFEQVCGKKACLALEAKQPKVALPRKQVAISPFFGHCLVAGEAECEPSDDSAFVYGFTHTIKSKPSDATSVEAALKTTSTATGSRSLVLSFGKLSWRYDDFAHVCDTLSGLGDECQALHLRLESSSRHAVVTKDALLATLIKDAGNESLSPLIQLVERPAFQRVGGRRQPFSVAVVSQDAQVASSDAIHCMGRAVDMFASFIDDSRLRLDASTISDTMAASALFFLFQNGALMDAAPSVYAAVARHLAAQGDQVEVYLKNTRAGKIMAWVSCAVLLALSLLVVALPNERARLEPPRGGNARAERFVAVQTEQIYPNLVYKKRFLIGKTGEEIKFRQFAVESVRLHHKMDEDEQIIL